MEGRAGDHARRSARPGTAAAGPSAHAPARKHVRPVAPREVLQEGLAIQVQPVAGPASGRGPARARPRARKSPSCEAHAQDPCASRDCAPPERRCPGSPRRWRALDHPAGRREVREQVRRAPQDPASEADDAVRLVEVHHVGQLVREHQAQPVVVVPEVVGTARRGHPDVHERVGQRGGVAVGIVVDVRDHQVQSAHGHAVVRLVLLQDLLGQAGGLAGPAPPGPGGSARSRGRWRRCERRAQEGTTRPSRRRRGGATGEARGPAAGRDP